MNPYLTTKAARAPRWYFPVIGVLGMLAAATVSVIVDFIKQRDWGTAAAGALLLAGFLWPVCRMVFHWLCGRKARALAHVLQFSAEAFLPLDQLQSRVSMRGAAKWAVRLIDRQYLQNAYVDKQRNALVLTAVGAPVRQLEMIQVECPHCGAANQLVKGRPGRCSYCDSVLPAQK